MHRPELRGISEESAFGAVSAEMWGCGWPSMSRWSVPIRVVLYLRLMQGSQVWGNLMWSFSPVVMSLPKKLNEIRIEGNPVPDRVPLFLAEPHPHVDSVGQPCSEKADPLERQRTRSRDLFIDRKCSETRIDTQKTSVQQGCTAG